MAVVTQYHFSITKHILHKQTQFPLSCCLFKKPFYWKGSLVRGPRHWLGHSWAMQDCLNSIPSANSGSRSSASCQYRPSHAVVIGQVVHPCYPLGRSGPSSWLLIFSSAQQRRQVVAGSQRSRPVENILCVYLPFKQKNTPPFCQSTSIYQ